MTLRLPSLARTGITIVVLGLLVAASPLTGQRADERETDTDSLATLTGQVVSAMTGGPLEDARVVLASSGRGAFTDASGQFTIADVQPGRDTVQVGLIGFAESQVPLTLKPGHVTTVTLMLSETVLRLEDITVEVKRRREIGKLSGFYDRMQYGHGHYITPEEIEQRQAQQTSDYLRGVPGVSVGAYRFGGARVRITRSQSRDCPPNYYLDGVPAHNLNIDELNRDDLLAIEVYRGASEVPAQFQLTSSGCGTILIWTRDGRDRTGRSP